MYTQWSREFCTVLLLCIPICSNSVMRNSRFRAAMWVCILRQLQMHDDPEPREDQRGSRHNWGMVFSGGATKGGCFRWYAAAGATSFHATTRTECMHERATLILCALCAISTGNYSVRSQFLVCVWRWPDSFGHWFWVMVIVSKWVRTGFWQHVEGVQCRPRPPGFAETFGGERLISEW